MKTTIPAATTLAVSDLTATNPVTGIDFTTLAEDIAAHGITEPLYLTTTETGTTRVIDGMRRLAAATALNLTTVPVTYRPLISVAALTAHPGNVRKTLGITPAFESSIRIEGVRTPIQVTRTTQGALRVVDGHRRLAAAIKAKLTHVPYTYEERDEAGQMLDMLTTARHRTPLTKGEETAALFEAAALGADTKRLAAAAGTTQVHAKQVAKLAKSQSVRAAVAHRADSGAPDLEDLAVLAELENTDPKAAEKAMADMAKSPHLNHGWIIRRTMTESKQRREAETHRAELEAAGARIRTRDELRDSAVRVRTLTDITPDQHAACQGQVWVLEDDESRYLPYCTNPALYGHTVPAQAQGKPSTAERRATIEGNRDWDTAEEIRREWLATFIGRTRRPKAEADRMTQITAHVLMSGSDVINRRATHPATTARLCQWLNLPQHTSPANRAAAVAKNPARATAMAFAAVAAAYEQHAVRTVWRTDGDHARAAIRTEAAEYLGWLITLGYQPSPIEQAVADNEPYNPAAVTLAADEASGATIS